MNTIEIPAFMDCHVHLRQDNLEGPSKGLMSRIAHYSGKCCSALIAMPNLKPPIHDAAQIKHMHDQYSNAVGPHTTVHMTAKWLPKTTPSDVRAAKEAGAIGFKLYPQGATTNAEDGIPWESMSRLDQQLLDVLGELEKQDMVLMCHGEAPGFVMDREDKFLPWFRNTVKMFPKLRMTLGLITTLAGVDMIKHLKSDGHRVLGTITLHHMMRTLDDVIGGKLEPDEFCMPIPKRPDDREALLRAATGIDSEFGGCFALGSDSAPHDPSTKYCKGGCAGVFTAPVLAESLVELFDNTNRLEHMGHFTTLNAAKFYGVEVFPRTLVMCRKEHFVPMMAGNVVCFRGGQKIPWAMDW